MRSCARMRYSSRCFPRLFYLTCRFARSRLVLERSLIRSASRITTVQKGLGIHQHGLNPGYYRSQWFLGYALADESSMNVHIAFACHLPTFFFFLFVCLSVPLFACLFSAPWIPRYPIAFLQ